MYNDYMYLHTTQHKKAIAIKKRSQATGKKLRMYKKQNRTTNHLGDLLFYTEYVHFISYVPHVIQTKR